ncbi:MAG: response regulator transcription factor [Xanthomonadaceae bacterium]|jgi:DNA-binding response OmpR family regulator|nr:response regulator transcription factor [Xanthomonadaceae bacterium]
MRVLLVEDDALLGDGIRTALRRAGMTVDWLRDGESARLALRQDSFDLAVLDLGLPKVDGMDVLKTCRSVGNAVPVLILTARDQLKDRLAALDEGADDYLTKPFDVPELIARLRALYRRSRGRAQSRLTVGELSVDVAQRQLFWKGQLIDLPRREFSLLLTLLENAGTVVSREVLEQRVYGWDEDVDSNALEVHVHHLRRKLPPAMIRTVRGVGYVLDPEIGSGSV